LSSLTTNRVNRAATMGLVEMTANRFAPAAGLK